MTYGNVDDINTKLYLQHDSLWEKKRQINAYTDRENPRIRNQNTPKC